MQLWSHKIALLHLLFIATPPLEEPLVRELLPGLGLLVVLELLPDLGPLPVLELLLVFRVLLAAPESLTLAAPRVPRCEPVFDLPP